MTRSAALDRTELVTCTGTRKSPAEERADLIVRLKTEYQSERPMDMHTRLLLIDAVDELERIDRIVALRGKYRDSLNPTRRWWQFWR